MPQRETSDNSVKVFSLNQTSQQKQSPSNKMSSSQTPQQKIQLPDEELDWIQMRIESGPVFPETTKEKMMRKIKSNPLVPIGCIATACALGYGLYNFRTGNRKMSQMMMRARIAAQGFTVVALIAGVVTTYGKTNN